MLISLILGAVGSLGLLFFAGLDLIKRYVYIFPYVAVVALTSASVILNYQTSDELTKISLAVLVPALLFVINYLDMKFNDESKIGGADVLGGMGIILTIAAVFLLSSLQGEYSLATTFVWVGSVVIYPALAAMILLFILEATYTYFYNKKHEEHRVFAAPMVPVISVVLIYMFISSVIQYL